MKKFFIVLFSAMILCSSVYADKILKSGYLIPTKKWADTININETFKISDPKNKIIVIYNHGSDSMDHKTKNCAFVNQQSPNLPHY